MQLCVNLVMTVFDCVLILKIGVIISATVLIFLQFFFYLVLKIF